MISPKTVATTSSTSTRRSAGLRPAASPPCSLHRGLRSASSSVGLNRTNSVPGGAYGHVAGRGRTPRRPRGLLAVGVAERHGPLSRSPSAGTGSGRRAGPCREASRRCPRGTTRSSACSPRPPRLVEDGAVAPPATRFPSRPPCAAAFVGVGHGRGARRLMGRLTHLWLRCRRGPAARRHREAAAALGRRRGRAARASDLDPAPAPVQLVLGGVRVHDGGLLRPGHHLGAVQACERGAEPRLLLRGRRERGLQPAVVPGPRASADGPLRVEIVGPRPWATLRAELDAGRPVGRGSAGRAGAATSWC